MARTPKNGKRSNRNVPDVTGKNTKSGKAKESKSFKLAKKDIRTTRDYARLMAAMMCDVITLDITPKVVNAAVNSGRQLMKVAEMHLKYGKQAKKSSGPDIDLLNGEVA